MTLVHLRHPVTNGECHVPPTTAENLRKFGGWVDADTPQKRTRSTSTSTPAPNPPTTGTPSDPDIPGDGEEE